MCFDLFTLHPPAGVLSGVICLHNDDMLGTGQELFESKLKEHDKLVGFGSMKRQSSITAKDSTRNMPVEKSQFPCRHTSRADLTLERKKQLDDELSATESHEFRGINGCLQWVTKELLYPFRFFVKVLQRRQGQARV